MFRAVFDAIIDFYRAALFSLIVLGFPKTGLSASPGLVLPRAIASCASYV